MRKRTKRKIWGIKNTIAHAIEGASIISKAKSDTLDMLELQAIESFSNGRATINDWQTVCNMLNLCETMAIDGVGAESLPCCELLQNELILSKQRFDELKKIGVTGTGLTAMRDVFQYAKLQRTSISLSLLEKYVRKTNDRVRSKAPEVIEL